MRFRTKFAFLASLLLALHACGAPPQGVGPETRPLARPLEGVASADPRTATPLVPLTRTPLGTAKPVSLPVHLVPSRDRRSALLVSDDPDRQRSYVRRIDEGGLGPVRVLEGRRAVQLVQVPAGPRLVSSDGRRLCVEHLEKSPPAPACHRLQAHFALPLGDRVAFLSQRLDRPEKGRGPSKRRPDDDEAVEVDELEVVLVPVAAEGQLEEEIDTGLSFVPPLDGMGVIDALDNDEGTTLLYYEHQAPETRGRREVPRARLRTARLDAEGKLVAKSERTIFEGDRKYGYIDGHHRQRLFGRERAVVVGRYAERRGGGVVRGFEAHLGNKPLSAPDAVFGVDPDQLAKTPLADEKVAELTALWDLAPRLVAGQPSSDAGRVAWIGRVGWFLQDGSLRSSTSTEPTEGIEASRLRLHWAHLESDGTGFARTDAGLWRIDVQGAELSEAQAPESIVGLPATIGDSLWVMQRDPGRAGGRLLRLLPSPREGPSVVLDHTALAEGAESGILIRRHGARLHIASLDEGGELKALASHESPFDGSFRAVATTRGVVVVGERGSELVAFSLDEAGVMSRVLSLAEDRLERLRATAQGAIVEGSASVLWLEGEKPVAALPRPGRQPGRGCVDGDPLPEAVPLPSPGAMQPLPAIADACVMSPVVQTASGLRWLGSRVEGPDARAELVDLPQAAFAPAAPAAPPVEEVALSSAVPPGSACPPEMVSVAGAYCIDRYEARLADADGRLLSPDYPPSPRMVRTMRWAWAFGRFYEGDLHAHAMPLPPLGREPEASVAFTARSERGLEPSGFASGHTAKRACEAAGKRLCSEAEWVRACRGEEQTKYPWGDDFALDRCNVYRFDHPARILHGNAAVGHLDPRLNRVVAADGPMRHPTGHHRACASRWGGDAVYDMVGNLDEWIDKKGGAFAGGFYARTTKSGCDALVGVHPRRYLDYSLGVRCCKQPGR